MTSSYVQRWQRVRFIVFLLASMALALFCVGHGYGSAQELSLRNDFWALFLLFVTFPVLLVINSIVRRWLEQQ